MCASKQSKPRSSPRSSLLVNIDSRLTEYLVCGRISPFVMAADSKSLGGESWECVLHYPNAGESTYHVLQHRLFCKALMMGATIRVGDGQEDAEIPKKQHIILSNRETFTIDAPHCPHWRIPDAHSPMCIGRSGRLSLSHRQESLHHTQPLRPLTKERISVCVYPRGLPTRPQCWQTPLVPLFTQVNEVEGIFGVLANQDSDHE